MQAKRRPIEIDEIIPLAKASGLERVNIIQLYHFALSIENKLLKQLLKVIQDKKNGTK